jgi:hypothetical protein
MPNGSLQPPPAPREHGAWGILLVPFATACGAAWQWNLPAALLLASVLCFYVARTSWLKRQWKWVVGLLAASVTAAVPLVVVWQLWWLPAFAVVAAPLASRPTGRSVWSQLLGVIGLTLTAPAAWYAATGKLDATAWRLWVVMVAYFTGGVLYVRMFITRSRLPNLAYHAGLALFLVAGAVGGMISWPVAAAFGPPVLRAVIGSGRLPAKLWLKKLGWTEVGYSLLFGASVVWAVRG